MRDGLTDEIINHLFKIESFSKVVSLNSVLTYKNTNKRIPEIAKELMVSMNTIRTHTKNIYSKLGVNSRRDAVKQARERKLI